MSFTREELGSLTLLAGLSDDELDWLRDNVERVELRTGERMFQRGEPADAMWIVVDGVIQGFEEHGGRWLLVATTGRGDVTGMLPYSRMTHYPRYTVASEPSVVLRLSASLFREMLHVSHELGRRLVAVMSDRVRGDVRLEQQNEKMMSLGRLSAGLAHELNNPAAAMRRAAGRLAAHRTRLPALVTALLCHELSEDGLEALERFRAADRTGASGLTELERSDREDELGDWLEDHGIGEPWEVAATFSEVGVAVGDLERLVSDLPDEAVTDALAWLGAGIESDRLVGEIEEAAVRISELVASIKVYSHMDRSSEHKPTDVRSGLDNTLTMLGHKLKKKSIELRREYEDDLQTIPANAGELNQVWTNLIDNAIDAVDDGGSVVLRARRKDQWVEVQVEDDGAGIPEELTAKIFEPFFTTKEVGVGTGLGLGIANRIVRTHQGHIEVRSKPGRTVMCVRLPLKPKEPIGR